MEQEKQAIKAHGVGVEQHEKFIQTNGREIQQLEERIRELNKENQKHQSLIHFNRKVKERRENKLERLEKLEMEMNEFSTQLLMVAKERLNQRLKDKLSDVGVTWETSDQEKVDEKASVNQSSKAGKPSIILKLSIPRQNA